MEYSHVERDLARLDDRFAASDAGAGAAGAAAGVAVAGWLVAHHIVAAAAAGVFPPIGVVVFVWGARKVIRSLSNKR